MGAYLGTGTCDPGRTVVTERQPLAFVDVPQLGRKDLVPEVPKSVFPNSNIPDIRGPAVSRARREAPDNGGAAPIVDPDLVYDVVQQPIKTRARHRASDVEQHLVLHHQHIISAHALSVPQFLSTLSLCTSTPPCTAPWVHQLTRSSPCPSHHAHSWTAAYQYTLCPLTIHCCCIWGWHNNISINHTNTNINTKHHKHCPHTAFNYKACLPIITATGYVATGVWTCKVQCTN
jgi:hypothetical protein